MPSDEMPSTTTKRPSLSERDSSTHSLVRGSPSADQHSTSHKTSVHKSHRAHVAGHGRVAHTRNPSYGRNLHKLGKLATVHGGDGFVGTRQHNRSKSSTPSTSPQAQHVKRDSSQVSLPRTASKSSMRKNLSAASLKCNGSVKQLAKLAKTDRAQGELKLQSPKVKQSQRATSVKFDIGSEGQDEDWTEESASQSPETTRHSSTAQSQELQPEQEFSAPSSDHSPHDSSSSSHRTPPQSPPQLIQIHRSSHKSTPQRSRVLDVDVITSRLLQRHPPHMVPPRLTSISAVATPTGGHSPRSFGHSQGSTLNGTPGMPADGVSRFISGGGSSGGTSGEGSHVPARVLSTSSPPNGSLDTSKRAKSTSQIASRNQRVDEDDEEEDDDDEPHPLYPRALQHSNHGAFNTSQSSRTQAKLNLQRASSNMDPPQPHVTPASLTPGVNGTNLPGQNSHIPEAARLAKQYEQACLEYAVVRRYRNPLGEALGRLDQIPGVKEAKEKRIQIERPKSRIEGRQSAAGSPKMGLSQSLRDDTRAKGNGRGEGRVRFEIGSKDDSGIGGHNDSNDYDDRDRDDGTDQLVRRIWESRIDHSSGD